jgi:NADPH:quinone reductase-like Zn-dependent oxidoreductase
MKAMIYTRYGPPEVLHAAELPKPAPKDNEILVKVRATTVTAGDTRMRAFKVPRWQWLPARLYLGVFGPRRKVLGMEVAGDVEAVGSMVTHFKPGDAVFASTFASNFGGYAEYKCLPADGIVAYKPAGMTYEEAAALPVGGTTALYILRNAGITAGQQVLIFGASGSVGTYAVQIAKHFGATVTGVCSAANVDMVQGLGADTVIDYTQQDFTRSGATYDIVFDAVGKMPAAQQKAALKPGGKFLNVNASSDKERVENLTFLAGLYEAGELKPVIDRTYPLAQTAEAHRYVDSGRKKGNVVITV